ncbi:hypothetical protein BWQ96_05788 [Gracilariopsis chorda]|uniref:Uncharacterized protein n=1 Tax=Gracilariopsis chorda TaxID=448386 RepID=A0A2V3ITL9_9FLOR|nr:hypothetical protein BWQ96_05788 [Gracilariopsis chorda]|eukprot:PXF44460.1 hypothetical protein BWQ96_05788 [Gracilariopsis chorda]
MWALPLPLVALLLVLLAVQTRETESHGLMVLPRQRGALRKLRYIPYDIDRRAPRDYDKHYPAGDKADVPGAGKRSQEKAAGGGGWTPYNPYDANFRWRSGVCGDKVRGRQEHLKGGKFYHNGMIVAWYLQGDTIGIEHSIVSNHNGFVEVHVCDVSKCPGGDISKECFLNGACTALRRAHNPTCDSGRSMHCGPIDRYNPTRWYLPCSQKNGMGYDIFEAKYATFRLPSHLYCQHCVLQWYWVTANSCSPPGLNNYFTGPDRPHWGKCKGQAGMRGGFGRRKRTCGGRDEFPEEYVQCADISILPRGSTTSRMVNVAYGGVV